MLEPIPLSQLELNGFLNLFFLEKYIHIVSVLRKIIFTSVNPFLLYFKTKIRFTCQKLLQTLEIKLGTTKKFLFSQRLSRFPRKPSATTKPNMQNCHFCNSELALDMSFYIIQSGKVNTNNIIWLHSYITSGYKFYYLSLSYKSITCTLKPPNSAIGYVDWKSIMVLSKKEFSWIWTMCISRLWHGEFFLFKMYFLFVPILYEPQNTLAQP